jgi:Fe-S-cluster containining protein
MRFECMQCGRCCHDLKLPLSVCEALAWASDGHQVDLLCDAMPATPVDPEDVAGRFRDERSFDGTSGDLPVRVHVVLAASHAGPCPYLRSDMRCGNYENRPRVCQIYPAEVAPRVALNAAFKACPPEAWGQ